MIQQRMQEAAILLASEEAMDAVSEPAPPAAQRGFAGVNTK
jgi:hypothetical protein